MRRRTATGVAVALLASLAGCLEPYSVHVDPAALARSPVPWVREDRPPESEGLWGPNTVEVLYTHQPQGSSPPYPGLLQVFGIREFGRRGDDALLELAHRVVDNATQARGIRTDALQLQEGGRTLAGGMQTRFFTQVGTVTAPGLFARDTKVRIIGEVGYDGRSATMVVAVGIAQVESTLQCPIIGGSCSRSTDETTWREIAADPRGTVAGGALARGGLLHNLVTHG
jgi:hypothetical protein